ncbi:hypothetical protein CDAR_573871 [Caerostris darwini]|uniref:Uncharacterized protein n=1 Tax=Caerostris darwini TaxID=1538125 RepID=A0AAV4T507_9ARAC|nr:hypothetical protein CDAR_573871 [Caerostris darwini]
MKTHNISFAKCTCTSWFKVRVWGGQKFNPCAWCYTVVLKRRKDGGTTSCFRYSTVGRRWVGGGGQRKHSEPTSNKCVSCRCEKRRRRTQSDQQKIRKWEVCQRVWVKRGMF